MPCYEDFRPEQASPLGIRKTLWLMEVAVGSLLIGGGMIGTIKKVLLFMFIRGLIWCRNSRPEHAQRM